MRLVVSALAAGLATACAVPNPLYGAESGSLGDGDGDGEGSAVGDSGVAGATSMSTDGEGTAGGEGTHSTTGTFTATAGTEAMDGTAGSGTSAASSSTGSDRVDPVHPPCSTQPDGFAVVGCWDFDALGPAGDEVLNRVEDGPSINFGGPVFTAPGFWGEALDVAGSPSGSAVIAPVGDVLIEVWYQTEAPKAWPPAGTLLQLWSDTEQTTEFASLTLLGPPGAQRRFEAGLQTHHWRPPPRSRTALPSRSPVARLASTQA